MLTPLLTALTLTAMTATDTYEQAFRQRADFFIRQTAAIDTDAMIEWFDGVDYFKGAGGDRHKYIMPPIIAKLHLDAKDEQALRAYRMLMKVNAQKGDRGLYHFAAFQRARLWGAVGDKLPDDVRAAEQYDVRNFAHIMDRGGTENHAFMHRGSGYIYAELVGGDYGGKLKRDGALKKQKAWLIDQCKRYYHVGTGEYDSSTYLGYTAASWANVYDFTEDQEMKAVAKAALDWLAVAMARKYFHGVNAGPEARGFARDAVGNVAEPKARPGYDHFKHGSVGTSSDWIAWLWFGDTAGKVMLDRDDAQVSRFPGLNLAMSTYRPHRIIRDIATKNVRMPYTSRGSKPKYYGGAKEGANKDQEILFVNHAFMMGTLYSPEEGKRTSGTIFPQTTMFKLAVRDKAGVQVFGAANGYHRHFPVEGRTPYDQYHQHKNTMINVCYVDAQEDERTKHRSILGVPEAAGDPLVKEGWYFWFIGDGFVAARPLNGKAAFESVGEKFDDDGYRWLVSRGKLTGWVVHAGQAMTIAPNQAGRETDPSVYGGTDDFMTKVTANCKLDLSRFNEEHREVAFESDAGQTMRIRHTADAKSPGGRPKIWCDGREVSYDDWPVYESPYVSQKSGSGKLELSNGHETLTIDFAGEKPTWTEVKE